MPFNTIGMKTKKELINSFFEDEQYSRRLMNCCMAAYRNSTLAKDAAQDLYIKLIEDAEGINFPQDKEEALYYLEQAVYHEMISAKRKQKRLPELVEEWYANGVAEETGRTPREQLEKLEALIAGSDDFTAEQLKLWQGLNKLCTLEELEMLMGKKRQTIHSLRNKLLMKIRKHFKREDLC